MLSSQALSPTHALWAPRPLREPVLPADVLALPARGLPAPQRPPRGPGAAGAQCADTHTRALPPRPSGLGVARRPDCNPLPQGVRIL